MSALARCSRYSRLFSRSFQSYSRNTAKNYLDQKKNLLYTLTRSTQRQSLTSRSYSAVSGENSSLKYDDDIKTSEETQSTKQTNKHEISQYPENYPASPFWRNYEFISKDFANVCKDMYQEIFGRKSIVLDRFHEFMAHVQQKDKFTEDELLLIFKTFGLENKEMADEVKVKWMDYLLERFHSIGVQLSTAHYNEILKNYNIANHKFSPVEFLSNMEKQGASPNVVTLSRIVVIYCKMGDIKSASNILDHMRKAQMTVSSVMYKNLIMGNFIAGDKETGMKLFRNCSELGFSMDSQMYEAVITGYAITGDLEGVKKMMEEAEENVVMLPNIIPLILQQVVPLGHKNIIEYVTSKPAPSYDWPIVYLGRTLKAMMTHGYTDLAFKYFSTIPENVPILYHKAIESGMRKEDIVKYVEFTKNLGMRNASFSYYFILAVSKFYYDTAISLLPHVLAEGTMRPQFMWPLIQYYKIMKDPEGIKKLLPFIETTDYSSVTQWLEPALNSFGVNLEEFHDILKNYSKFSEGQINAFMTIRHQKAYGWEQAARFAESCEVVEDVKDFFGSLLGGYMMSANFTENWKSLVDIFSVTKNCQVGLIWNLQKTVDHQELKDYILKKNVTVHDRNLQEKFKALFTEEERQQVIRKEYTFDEIINMEYEGLLELQDTLGKNLSFCLRLMNKSYQHKDWDVYRRTLSKVSVEPSKIQSTLILMQMAYFYAQVEGQMDNCRKCIDACQSKEFVVNQKDVVNMCATLCENGMQSDAIKILRICKCNKFVFIDQDLISKNTFFNMEPTRENAKIAKEMLEVLNGNQYFMNDIFRRSCLKAYWNFICNSENVEEVIEAFEYLSQTYKYIPRQYVAVLSTYFKKGDKSGLQAAYDKFTEHAYEQTVLLSLAAAFVENGEMLKAKKVLATPGMRVSKILVQEIVSRWVNQGQPQHMEAFSSLCSSLPGDIDQAGLKSLQLQAMCNQESPDVDACIQFFEKYFENEEDSVADLNTLKCYGRFLKKHRPEKILDHYILDLINEEDSRERKVPERKVKDVDKQTKDVKQPSPKTEKKSSAEPEKLKEEDLMNLTPEEKFSKLIKNLQFEEAVKISKELSDKEFAENLPGVPILSRFLRYLFSSEDADTVNRVPPKMLDLGASDMVRAMWARKFYVNVCKFLLEKQPDLFMERIPNLPKDSKVNSICASLHMNDTEMVKKLCKVAALDSNIILGVFKKSSNQDYKMELPAIRQQHFAILDSEIGESEKALAYACTMERLYKTNDTEGVELLAEKAKSAGLTFEEMTKQLKHKKKDFVETLQQLEKSFAEQNKELPWASTNTWTMDISNMSETKSTSLAEKGPSDIIPEEEHHSEVIVAEKEHVDITLKPDEHTELFAVKKGAEELVDTAKTVSDQTEPEMKDKAKVISDDSSKGS